MVKYIGKHKTIIAFLAANYVGKSGRQRMHRKQRLHKNEITVSSLKRMHQHSYYLAMYSPHKCSLCLSGCSTQRTHSGYRITEQLSWTKPNPNVPCYLLWPSLLILYFIHCPYCSFNIFDSNKTLVQAKIMTHCILNQTQKGEKVVKLIQFKKAAYAVYFANLLTLNHSENLNLV